MADPKHYPWEDALAAFASSTQATITNRDAVLAQPWITGIEVRTGMKSGNDERKAQKTGSSGWAGYDMWAEWEYNTTSPWTTIVGVTVDWDFWQLKPPAGDTSTPLGHFEGNADTILAPLLWGDCRNDRTSAQSYNDAATVIRAANLWVGNQQQKIQTWADEVDGAGSDFQGSAAGRFKEVLIGTRNEFIKLHLDLGTSDAMANALDAVAEAMRTAHGKMYDGYNAWRVSGGENLFSTKWTLKGDDASFSWPHACVHAAFAVATAPLVPTMVDNNTASFTGGPVKPSDNDAFKQWLEELSKKIWTTWIEITLDKYSAEAMAALKTAYSHATAVLQKVDPPKKWLPADKPPTAPDGGPKPPPGSSGAGGDGKGGDLGLGGSGDKKPPGTKGATPPPPPPTHVPGSFTGIGGNNGNGGGGSGQAPLLGKDGKPLLDKDGKPLYVPPGTTVNAKGELIGPDGKPLLGADGKPRHVPPGTTVGKPTQNQTQTGGGLGAPFTVPPGSKKNEDGMVTGPGGAALKDANGNPVVLGKDDTIDKDGTVRNADGQPISQFEQLLNDQSRAYAGRTGGASSSGGGGGSWTGLPPSFGSGSSFGTSGLGGAGGSGSFKGGTDLFGESFGKTGGSGLAGPKATGGISASGPPTIGTGGRMATLGGANGGAAPAEEAALTGRAAAGRAAAATAAEEAQLVGRGVSTTGGMGGPMMPPMGAGAGAGAAGAGQSEKERQRTTWLAEDEEVWGTDSGAVTGVIGR
ncbi:hypothetical protein ACFZDG_03395 [Kitasatospora xanthocidica]|uniref:hypothetical protein n=1 Tax=Kitasatospora xanthocidica TaxID=83382 RepID=UPI0036E59A4E